MHFIDKIFFFIKTTLYIRRVFKNKLTHKSVQIYEKYKKKERLLIDKKLHELHFVCYLSSFLVSYRRNEQKFHIVYRLAVR